MDVASGTKRRVLLHLPELMQVEFKFEKGAGGPLHAHPHIQVSYVAEGRFDVTIDGNTQTLEQGGSFIVPGGLMHGAKALTAGRLIEVFTPQRDEFV
ncbi:cupin domain-containing protein [Devosia rhodophyticola]|uniref:Cupin domain-containing protein n=2 Tax=Devosia rhodophyticola TaxID=3026423 RepID=A0ABY7Z1N2_9HYPH|nr:cupin domain-containing protein [Devosia rhodophyticola]WDR07541.1 cupin domain-containing protein [Devosia rhodophyticola]